MNSLLMVLVLVTADPSPLPSRASSYAFYGALNAADFASTEFALSRGGVHEANPLPGLQTIGGRAAVKVLATAGLTEIDRMLYRRGKRKTVLGIRITMAALTVFVVQHNLRVQ